MRTTPSNYALLLSVITGLSFAPAASAQKHPAPEDPKRIIQIFDVADLIHTPAENPVVPAPKAAGGGNKKLHEGVPVLKNIPIVSFLFKRNRAGVNTRQTVERAEKVQLDSLIKDVRTFLRPGLAEGDEIKTLGKSTILAMATPEKLAWIERFLESNRKRRRQQVDIELKVMTMPTRTFEEHVKPLLDISDRTLQAAEAKPQKSSIRGSATPLVNTATGKHEISTKYALVKTTDGLSKLEATLVKSPAVTTLAIPKIRSGPLMQASIHAGDQISYIKDFEIQVAKNQTIADPVVGVIRDGIGASCSAAFLANDRIGLRFSFSITDVVKPIPTFTTTIGVGNKVTLQLPQVRMARIASQVELKADETALFALKTLDGKFAVLQLRATPAAK